MDPLCFPLVVLCLFRLWTVTYAIDCGEGQFEGEERCCDMCPPGKYVKEFCTKDQQTVCSPCEEGYFSSQYSLFDRCDVCQRCQQNYTQKCTPTTDAVCSCQPGFLCSNSLCSHCQEDKDSVGGTPKVSPTQTANKQGNGSDLVSVILSISFLLLSVVLLLLLATSCLRKLRRLSRDTNATADNLAITAKTADFQLSQEESGLSLIIQDVSKDNEYVVQFNLMWHHSWFQKDTY